MEKHALIRTIYLYVFALLGLVLITIGSVNFVDMGLKAWVFTQADDEQRMWEKMPPRPVQLEAIEKIKTTSETGEVTLTINEKNSVLQSIHAYEEWEERQSKVDVVVARRHREASTNLALILIGIPLYLYHWGIIRRETKKSK
jgi:hypothetical protein